MKPTDFAKHLSEFLTQYLPEQRNVSPNTIKSYRDTFTLYLRYFKDKGIQIERLYIKDITVETVREFLTYLEINRKSSPRTRNNRLAAIHSFFRFLQIEMPESIVECQRILAIPFKRHKNKIINYLTPEQLKAILSQVDLESRVGHRDCVLLSVLYDTGSRVQEIIDLSVRDVRLDTPAQIRITGKGRKERAVPIMENTKILIRDYLQERGMLKAPHKLDNPLFYNRSNQRLTRSGVSYILNKYVGLANQEKLTLPEKITPHVFRHTKAMHLLQAGVPLVIIRDFLGHVDIKTSEVYAKADLTMKQKALEKVADIVSLEKIPIWQNNKSIFEWLMTL